MRGCSGDVCGFSQGGMHGFSGGHVWLLPGVGGHAWLLLGGLCGCSGGHAWLLQGGMHVFSGGVCMVSLGGVHGIQ